MAPQIYPLSNPWNLCIDCLQGRRDSADVAQLRVLRWGEHLGDPGGPSVITASLEEGSRRVREGNVSTEARPEE